jgi:hypothetical protein
LITEDLQEIVFYGAAESLDALDMCAETMDNGEFGSLEDVPQLVIMKWTWVII